MVVSGVVVVVVVVVVGVVGVVVVAVVVVVVAGSSSSAHDEGATWHSGCRGPFLGFPMRLQSDSFSGLDDARP